MTAFYLIFSYIIIVNKTRAPHLPLELGIQNNVLISVYEYVHCTKVYNVRIPFFKFFELIFSSIDNNVIVVVT